MDPNTQLLEGERDGLTLSRVGHSRIPLADLLDHFSTHTIRIVEVITHPM